MPESILAAFQQDQYRLDNLQARIYEPKTRDQWPADFLGQVYLKLRGDRFSNRRPNGTGILEVGFCGMADVSFDAIVAYLCNRPLIVMGVWEEVEEDQWDDDGNALDPKIVTRFREAGIAFPTTLIGEAYPDRSGFFGYLFFPEFWGDERMELLGLLGLTAIFVEFKLAFLHGVRYRDNWQTVQFVKKYGFRDDGTIEGYMLRRGKLVSAVASTLSRPDFEAYVENALLEGRDAQPEPAVPEPVAQPEPEPESLPLFDGIPRFR